MSHIAITDYLLLIPYLAFFYVLAKRMSKKVAPNLKNILLRAFWLRMLGCVLYSMVIQYYYGYGDSFTFFQGSNFFTNKISEDPSNFSYLFAPIKEIAAWYQASPESDYVFEGYFSHPSGNMVMKISAVLSYLCFNRFLLISLFFGFFSFVGQWKLFQVFNEINSGQGTRLLAWATLYTPSIWFWGSGLMKDSICLGGLGVLIYILYTVITKKKISPLHVIGFLIIFYMVAVIKSYITNILLISILLTAGFVFIKGVKSLLARVGLLLLSCIVAGVVLYQIDFGAQLQETVEDAVLQINAFQQSYQNVTAEVEDSKGGFSMKEIDPSLSSIILRAPGVILSCLYRPFVWESRKVMIFFTSLESLMLLCCTLYLIVKSKLTGFFSMIFSNQYLFFCFVLSILFALIIGFTTFNFGTMIRYKIIFLPFFYFLHVNIYLSVVRLQKKNRS